MALVRGVVCESRRQLYDIVFRKLLFIIFLVARYEKKIPSNFLVIIRHRPACSARAGVVFGKICAAAYVFCLFLYKLEWKKTLFKTFLYNRRATDHRAVIRTILGRNAAGARTKFENWPDSRPGRRCCKKQRAWNVFGTRGYFDESVRRSAWTIRDSENRHTPAGSSVAAVRRSVTVLYTLRTLYANLLRALQLSNFPYPNITRICQRTRIIVCIVCVCVCVCTLSSFSINVHWIFIVLTGHVGLSLTSSYTPTHTHTHTCLT